MLNGGGWTDSVSDTEWCCAYLHHKEDCVEDDEGHDEVLEGRGLDDPPEAVAHAHPLLRHVPLERRRVNGEVDAGFLQNVANLIRP